MLNILSCCFLPRAFTRDLGLNNLKDQITTDLVFYTPPK